MADIHVDGYTVGGNPGTKGGGFCVVFATAEPRRVQVSDRPGFTNNEAELCGVAYAAEMAECGDRICTDSEVVTWWVRNCKCKARPDLRPIALRTRSLVNQKNLTVQWVPREKNLAGIYNDSM